MASAGAGRGTRTLTVLPPADFESAASTDSAIPAMRPLPRGEGQVRANYNRPVKLSDFDYVLPPELIAQHPAAERATSRLLRVEPSGELRDLAFRDLPSLLDPRDLLVFNDTRVIRARLRGRKDTGGEIEVLVERVLGADTALAHVRASKTPKPGRKLIFAPGVTAEVTGRRDDLFECASRPRRACSTSWPRTARCPCRPTSRTRRRPTTSRATRRFTQRCRARWRRRPQGCTSTRQCWRRWWRRASPRRA